MRNYFHHFQLLSSFWIIFTFSFSGSLLCYSQDTQESRRKCFALRITIPPIIDGILDDEAWYLNEWEGGFIQHMPYEGLQPTQPTEFKIVYDDANIYVAIKALDSSPDSITVRMARRDQSEGDFVLVALDSYHDLQTAFMFGANSAGIRSDVLISNNGQNEDESWDPIWQAKTQIYEWGWATEMKIPFTQLRFKKECGNLWGLEIGRYVFRLDEYSLWQHIPRNSPGFVHLFGELAGLQDLRPKKQFDILPYSVASYNKYEPEPGNPFRKGSNSKFNAGADAKIGITNDLTLDLTVNPDFGQVETDPSEVNLTAYESFFPEKRPFFIEGSNITSFNVGLGDGVIGNDNLFYSRRIGRPPHGDPDLSDNEFANLPPVTNILGAVKLTGKTENGLSIGILESITNEVFATIDSSGHRYQKQIEPLTNYSLLRIKKDFNKGNTILGGSITNTYRLLNNSDLALLNKNATTGGIDFTRYFDNRNYMVSILVYGSNINGTGESITEFQESSARYFQRPDNDYVDYNTDRITLNGFGGKIRMGKTGGNWNYLWINTWKSPGVELNDMGYMREADRILNVFWTGYNFTQPFSIFRSLFINTDIYTLHDFGGNLNSLGFEANTNANFKNFWNFGLGGGISTFNLSNSILRGGPSMNLPGNGRLFTRIGSNDRKKLIVNLNTSVNRGFESYQGSDNIDLEIEYKPLNNLNLTINPFYSNYRSVLQYTDQVDYNADQRYIFGSIDQKTIGMSLRVNYTFAPDLTIQYWGQPFLASGKYEKFKRISNPKADNFSDRYITFNPQQLAYDSDNEYYRIDEDLNGTVDYQFDNPDFNFNEWLSNLVLRWEFRPGSVVYLVWSQSREYSTSFGNLNFSNNLDELFTEQKANNVFLLKLSWRIGIN